MTIDNELYPFATQDGKAIPVEIIQPTAFIMLDLTTSYASLPLVALFNLAALYSEVDCVVDLTGAATTLNVAVPYTSMLFVPADVVVMAVLPVVTAKARAIATPGKLFVQGVQRWAALNLSRQFTAKTS